MRSEKTIRFGLALLALIGSVTAARAQNPPEMRLGAARLTMADLFRVSTQPAVEPRRGRPSTARARAVRRGVGHALLQATYINAGRANGLSFLESAGITAFGSGTWEYISRN